MNVRTTVVGRRLRAPVHASHSTATDRELLVLELDKGGLKGYGEAAPLAPYDGVRMEDVRAALEDCRALLRDGDGAGREELLAACRAAAVLPQAVAAIDLALYDLAGTTPASATPVPVNATIAAADRAGAAQEAAAARAAGFGCVKVKVGLGDDAGRVAAVRAAVGSEVLIRLDANGAWSAREAEHWLRALEPAAIELCEEPVHGLEQPHAPCPLALDESASLPGALDERYADAVCLKITAHGGISGVIEAAARARATGYEVYLASTLDGPLGIAAALHAAAAITPDRHCGLATLGLFEQPIPESLQPVAGKMTPPVSISAGLLGWYGI